MVVNGIPRTCESAVTNGQFNVLQWSRQNGCRWNAQTCVSCIETVILTLYNGLKENCQQSSVNVERDFGCRDDGRSHRSITECFDAESNVSTTTVSNSNNEDGIVFLDIGKV